VARPVQWPPGRQIEAAAAWYRETGDFPLYDDWRSIATTRHPEAFHQIAHPSAGTVARTWRWAVFKSIYAEFERVFHLMFRDPWSGAPIGLLDWDDVGYELPPLVLVSWHRKFVSLHPGHDDDWILLWDWLREAKLVDAKPTFPGGGLGDVEDSRAAEIRAARAADQGLYPPRVLQRCVIGTDDWCSVPTRRPPDGISESADLRIDGRLRWLLAPREEPQPPPEPGFSPIKVRDPVAFVAFVEQWLVEHEATRQDYKSNPARGEYRRPEWTDTGDRSPFCCGHEDEQTTQFRILYGIDGREHFVSVHDLREGVCDRCGLRYPAVGRYAHR
jgi:hypothetical protein